MEKTPHVLLVADGAEEFAKSQGIQLVSPYYFYTEREWNRFKDAEKQKKPGSGHGTVGVVALDMAGNLAAGTSTGGTVLKMPGHVTLQQATNYVVMKELVQQHGDGGVIALDKQDNIATPFNTTGMMTGAVRNDGKIKISGIPGQ